MGTKINAVDNSKIHVNIYLQNKHNSNSVCCEFQVWDLFSICNCDTLYSIVL